MKMIEWDVKERYEDKQKERKTEVVVIFRNPTQCEIYMEGDKLYQSECYT